MNIKGKQVGKGFGMVINIAEVSVTPNELAEQLTERECFEVTGLNRQLLWNARHPEEKGKNMPLKSNITELLWACKTMINTYSRTVSSQEGINQLTKIEQAIDDAEKILLEEDI